MYAIAFFGLMIVIISAVMVASPELWGRMILKFVRLRYFHVFEISSRIVFGTLLIAYADESRFPQTIEIVGYVLLSVGLGLMFIPPSFHRRLGDWFVEKLSRYFRPAGFVSLPFGVFLIYAAF